MENEIIASNVNLSLIPLKDLNVTDKGSIYCPSLIAHELSSFLGHYKDVRNQPFCFGTGVACSPDQARITDFPP